MPAFLWRGSRGEDEYSRNTQIAELNSLNATLAVIKWKKIMGFYLDQANEHHSIYRVGLNRILNEGLSMMDDRSATWKHEFVDTIPADIEPSVLYVSIRYRTSKHLCPCGCCFEVVTPILPNKWCLKYNGAAVSLYPSVGNWSLDCKSH